MNSLQVYKATEELRQEHVDACDVPLCPLCATVYDIWQRDEQDGNEPWDFDPNDEQYDSRA